MQLYHLDGVQLRAAGNGLRYDANLKFASDVTVGEAEG